LIAPIGPARQGLAMVEENRSRLGRGLAALMGDVGEETRNADRPQGSQSQKKVPTEFLKANPRNPRKTFEEHDLADLSASIKEKGIIQPIVVREKAGIADVYEIIAGERRWRAAQRAGLHEVPIVVVQASDRDALEMAIIENVQRADLNPIEEAAGYERLMAEFAYAQSDLAQMIGKSRSHIANMLRLMKLPDSVKELLRNGSLSAGHGRALLTVEDPEQVALRAVERGLTVRDLERLGQNDADTPRKKKPSAGESAAEKDADTRALERMLEDALGMAVSLTFGKQGGELRIKYQTLDQLDALCLRLRG
jgi:ParB family chromosome partitioning protein